MSSLRHKHILTKSPTPFQNPSKHVKAHTFSKKVSGRPGSNTSLQYITVQHLAFRVIQIPLLNQSVTFHHNKLLKLGVMPMLALRNARFGNVDGNLAGIQCMNKFRKLATLIHIHLKRTCGTNCSRMPMDRDIRSGSMAFRLPPNSTVPPPIRCPPPPLGRWCIAPRAERPVA